MYRWLTSSTQAKLYDPLLQRLVQKLMKKNFFMLLYELKNLGCTVIHGNFNRVMVKTTKRDIEEAITHINFVVKTITENPLFKFISLSPQEYWKILLFKDYHNYAGIRESNDNSCDFNYNVCLHLPEGVRDKFKFIICEYVLKVYQFNQKHKHTLYQQVDDDLDFGQVQGFMDTAEGFEKEKDHKFISDLISEYFCQKLLTTVEKFAKWRDNIDLTDASDREEDGEMSDEQDRDFARQARHQELAKWEFP